MVPLTIVSSTKHSMNVKHVVKGFNRPKLLKIKALKIKRIIVMRKTLLVWNIAKVIA